MVDIVETPVVTSDELAPTTHEAEAREMGWTDKEHFRGNPEKWVDADAFYEKGQHVLPIVRSQWKIEKEARRKLEVEISAMRGDNMRLKQFMEQQALRDQGELKAEIASLKAAKITAIQDGDGAKVMEIEDRMEAIKTAPVQVVEKPAPDTPAPDPVYEAWVEKNKWYSTKPAMTGWANARAYELNVSGASLESVLETIDAEAREMFPAAFDGDKSKSRPSPQRSNGASKAAAADSYEAMPAEDRKICDRMVTQYGLKKDVYVKNYWSDQ